MPATYDGAFIFGAAVKMQHMLNPPAEQVNAFFGLSGTQSLYGGGRGRVFTVAGVFTGVDLANLNANEDLFLSYVDGIARILIDTRGRVWAQVLVRPPQVGERILQDQRGLYLPYKAILTGLA